MINNNYITVRKLFEVLCNENADLYGALKALGATVLSKTSASSLTGGTLGKYVHAESRRWRGRLFHRRGPATVNERSARLV